MKHLTIAVAVSAALFSGAGIAQEQKAAQTAAKAAAQSAQVAQAGGAAATTTGGASAGAATATTATASFGSAVAASLPAIGITAGMSAVANSQAGNVSAPSH